MCNVGNERGEVLNSVLTTGEGDALEALCQGLVQRYKDANEPPPDLIYVDRDCCKQSGMYPSHCIIFKIDSDSNIKYHQA